MSNPDFSFQAFINPLTWLEVQEAAGDARTAGLSGEDVLNFICRPEGRPKDAKEFANRYLHISGERARLFAVPAEAKILEKLIWPLHHAKACYVVGNCLGTIALCGLVAEMAAILAFDIFPCTLKGARLSEAEQRGLFGSSFEKLGQQRRVDVLTTIGAISTEVQKAFDLIREKRKAYLHIYSKGFGTLADDAVAVFDAAITVVCGVLGTGIENGRIVLRPELISYLQSKGLATSA